MKSKHLLLTLLLALIVPWAARAQETKTVHQGTNTSRGVPMYAYYFDEFTKSQHVIPADDLANMSGGTITSIKYYYTTSSYSSTPYSTATQSHVSINLYITEVESASISSLMDFSSYTPAYTGYITYETDGTVAITLDHSYIYGGGNLMIGVENPTKGGNGNYDNVYFYGETGTQGASTYSSSSSSASSINYSSSNTSNLLPYTTFTYTPAPTPTSAPGVTTSETIADLTNVSVKLGGTITDMGGANSVQAGICYGTTSEPTTADAHVQSKLTSTGAYTQNITGLQPNTIYHFRAYAYSGYNSLENPTYGDIYSFTTAGNITLNQPANGEISVSVNGGTATTSSTYALEGQSVTLTATAADGYSLDCWNVTGVTGTASGDTYTFTMPANNVTATASIIPTSGGSSSESYYQLASSVESGEKYLVVKGNGTTASASTTFYAMEWNNTTSTSGLLDYGTPTFKDTEKHKITGITPHVSGRTLSDFVWTITASGSDYTLSAENGGSTYYLIETSASDGYLHAYTTSNSSYNEDQTKWTFYKSSNEYFLIHNSYWYSQYSNPGGRYYYLNYSNGFRNYWSGTTPANMSSSDYYMYLYKLTSVTNYAIVATANPSEGGTVAGSDYYASGESCTLTATPAFGYDFVSWTEGNTVVSTDAEYTFTVSGARTLVANFESQGSCIKPTDLAQVPNTLAAHQAQLSWTENNEATEWELVYSTESDFNPDNETPIAVNSNPATIPGLEQETTYYASVRAICGQGSQSGWSTKSAFETLSGHQAPTATYDLNTLTAHTVTVTWTGVATNVNHQSYDLYYSTIDETPTTQTPQYTGLTETSKGLVGLDGGTTYYVWVRDNCGDDGYSDWSNKVPFTTEIACPAPTAFNVVPNSITGHTADLTWQGTSDSYVVSYRTAAYNDGSMIKEDFTGLTSGIPTGWDNSEGTTTNDSYKWNYYNGGHNAAPCLRFNSYNNSNNNTNFLKTPSKDFPAGKTMQLSFWWKNPAGKDLSVYISTDGGTTKTPIVEGLTSQSAWKQETFSLTDYIGATNVTIHFKGTSNYGSGDAYIYLDEVQIGEAIPEGEWLTVTPEPTEAPVTLTGLLAERKYEAKVKGNCGTEGYSQETAVKTFKTAIACPAPSALQTVEGTLKSNQVGLSWTNGGAEDWIVAYKKTLDNDFTEVNVATADVTIEGTTVTYTLTGLDEETDYVVKVQDNCEASVEGDGVSAWTTEVPFSTIAACSAMDPVVSDITHHNATVTWNGESNVGYTVKYREAERIDGILEEFGTSIPEGWSTYNGKLTASGSSYTATLSSSSSWSFGTWSFNNTESTDEVLTGHHARVNIYGNNQKWLVTPAFTVNNNALTFDMALTNYYATQTAPHTTGSDDKFMVLVSTDNMDTWNILREWNNEDGAEYVYNNINQTATGEAVSINVSNYVGQEVYIAFYGESTTSNADNYIHIDNVVCGNIIPATAWEEEPSTENTVDLSQLTAGTKYEVKVVPNCDETLASDTIQFTTVSPNQKWFITEGNWNVNTNWEPTGVPTIDQDVVLKANATIASGEAFAKSIAGTGTGTDAKTLTIEDGAKLKHLNSNVRATVKKHINAWTIQESNEAGTELSNGWYLIANPTTSNFYPSEENGFLVGNYDLYNWDHAQADEWRNFEVTGTFASLKSGAYGYLYANNTETDLTYTGTINAYTSYKYRSCSVASNPDNYDFPSWYLLGNPYLYDAYLTNTSTNTATTTALPYYRMNQDGDEIEPVEAGTPIEPMQGFFYQGVSGATDAYVVTYVPTVQTRGNLNMNLRSGNKQLDKAIVRFGEGQQLSKFSFRANSSKIYMPVEGKDYAIANAEQMGEMPVSFKAEKNGSYTLSFTAEEVSFAYLHLIDNLTGTDVDLLANPSYSFDARTTDYASRFKLVFATGNNSNEDNFAFFSNGNFVINNDGEATLQVVDVMGRIIKSESINGCANVNVNAAPGVYMLRLINGDNMKVQKVVVR